MESHQPVKKKPEKRQVIAKESRKNLNLVPAFEALSLPALRRRDPCGFAFYVAHPIRSILASYFVLSRIRAYRATAEFFDRRLAASGERQQSRLTLPSIRTWVIAIPVTTPKFSTNDIHLGLVKNLVV